MGSVSYSAHISNGKSAITIFIHALETDDKGERIQEIEIYYRFIGKID